MDCLPAFKQDYGFMFTDLNVFLSRKHTAVWNLRTKQNTCEVVSACCFQVSLHQSKAPLPVHRVSWEVFASKLFSRLLCAFQMLMLFCNQDAKIIRTLSVCLSVCSFGKNHSSNHQIEHHMISSHVFFHTHTHTITDTHTHHGLHSWGSEWAAAGIKTWNWDCVCFSTSSCENSLL